MIFAVTEQDGFPGLPIPADVAVPPAPPASDDPQPSGTGGPAGQALLRNQPAIWDAEPEPRQLALIPDPDPWEADRPPPAGARPPGRAERTEHASRRRRRTTIPSPGQLSLF
jgi:hypothetical protein